MEEDLSAEDARHEDQDTDAEGREVEGKGFGEAFERHFRRVVHGDRRRWALAENAAHRHDRAGLVGAHGRENTLDDADRAEEVGRHLEGHVFFTGDVVCLQLAIETIGHHFIHLLFSATGN